MSLMKNKFIVLLLSVFAFGALVHGAETSWWKQVKSRKRRVDFKTTAVAAVRGVSEPSDVDPQARDYQSVARMEQRVVPIQKIKDFCVDAGTKAILEIAADEKALMGLEEETNVGRDVAANVIAQFGFVENEPLTEYVNLVGLSVARLSPRPEINYRFAVLNTDILNAFAAPGGYIFITKGLLKMIGSEAELAAVLSHEVGHVAHRHVVKEIRKSKVLDAVIPSYVKAAAKRAVYMSQVTDLAVKLLWRGLSKEDELEADRFGAALEARAGYDPQAFGRMLERFKSVTAGNKEPDKVKLILSTHPSLEERLQNIETLNVPKNDGSADQIREERYKSNVQGL